MEMGQGHSSSKPLPKLDFQLGMTIAYRIVGNQVTPEKII
jgi:hypothetical protein